MEAQARLDVIDDPRRLPAVEGSRNLRDLGGYVAADGRSIRWGMVYRTGSLAGLTADGCAALSRLGIRSVCDLRSSREQQSEPYGWHAALGVSYWSRDYETSFGELRRLLSAGMKEGDQAQQAMLAGYRSLPYEQAPAYREVFRLLAAGEVPLVFGCSAGKDRAGTGAALVLLALGVPRDVIVEDYALTNRVVDLEKAIVQRSAGSSSLSQQPPEVVRAILGCHPHYIEAAIDAVASSPSVFDSYLRETLGVDRVMLEGIRSRLLE